MLRKSFGLVFLRLRVRLAASWERDLIKGFRGQAGFIPLINNNSEGINGFIVNSHLIVQMRGSALPGSSHITDYTQ